MTSFEFSSPSEFLTFLVFASFAMLLAVYIPVKLVAKWRRIKRSRVRITCRICGYRFLRTNPEAICPHCEARNR
ncbi:MAG: hypothetical protein IJ985_02490 [Akkermansia sp.]|nr:hypothetical protein [Akkermansia sp.]